jgi:hypothetical protein
MATDTGGLSSIQRTLSLDAADIDDRGQGRQMQIDGERRARGPNSCLEHLLLVAARLELAAAFSDGGGAQHNGRRPHHRG